MTKLIPDPPLSDLPKIPYEGFRWKISHPFFDTDGLRRIKLQKRVGPFWHTVEWSVWNAREQGIYESLGLVWTMLYILREYDKKLSNSKKCNNVYGVSRW